MNEGVGTPITNRDNGTGRDELGRFSGGNQYGTKGSPYGSQMMKYKRALVETVSVEDVKAILERLVLEARAGRKWAIKLLLERVLGPAQVNPGDLGAGGVQNIQFVIQQPQTKSVEVIEQQGDEDGSEISERGEH